MRKPAHSNRAARKPEGQKGSLLSSPLLGTKSKSLTRVTTELLLQKDIPRDTETMASRRKDYWISAAESSFHHDAVTKAVGPVFRQSPAHGASELETGIINLLLFPCKGG